MKGEILVVIRSKKVDVFDERVIEVGDIITFTHMLKDTDSKGYHEVKHINGIVEKVAERYISVATSKVQEDIKVDDVQAGRTRILGHVKSVKGIVVGDNNQGTIKEGKIDNE